MYSQNHIKITFEGDTGGGEDIWSTGVRIIRAQSVPNIIGEGILEDAVLNAVDAWDTFWSSATSYIPPYFRTLSVKAASIGLDGKYPEGVEAAVVNLDVPLVGTGNANTSKAPQTTVVASLRTAAERGYATKGRMYLPVNTIGLDGTSGRWTNTTSKNAVGNAAAALISDLAFTLGDTNFVPAVMSQVGNGMSRPITRVLIGDVLDTQRRRKNAYTEVYEQYNLT